MQKRSPGRCITAFDLPAYPTPLVVAATGDIPPLVMDKEGSSEASLGFYVLPLQSVDFAPHQIHHLPTAPSDSEPHSKIPRGATSHKSHKPFHNFTTCTYTTISNVETGFHFNDNPFTRNSRKHDSYRCIFLITWDINSFVFLTQF